MFATHFHEITRLAEEYANVSNMHVSALCTDDNFTLLHSIKPGVCNKSFGIQVSRMVNFPKEVVKVNYVIYLTNLSLLNEIKQ